MNDIDRKIQAALQREDNSGPLGTDPNFAEELLEAFRGRHRWLSALAVAINLVLFAGVVWAGFRFLRAENVQEQLRWGAAGFVLFLAMSFIKLWFWLELHSNRVLREVKRVELLLISRGR
jgi:hypothetical protein